MTMTILTGDFGPDALIAALPAGVGSTDGNPPEPPHVGQAQDSDLKLYLRHVEGGETIRSLAREVGCHASTILRRIRRFEARRDDPLVDRGIDRAGDRGRGTGAVSPGQTGMKQIARILRRLAEPGAQLVVAEGMDKAIVVRDDIRTAILDRELAEHMAIRAWVRLMGQGRVSRYAISAQGREVLRTILAARRGGPLPRGEDLVPATPVMARSSDHSEKPASGHADRHRQWEEREITDPEDGCRRRARINIAESPLMMLARRREPDGRPFLAPELVAAGERLREDFELAQMGPRITQNWDRFLTAGIDVSGISASYGGGSEGARNRVAAALRELGPGMGDVCLRICCFLQGIEMTERRLGWSARSGKIVLRLGLMRLERHYRETYGSGAPLIG